MFYVKVRGYYLTMTDQHTIPNTDNTTAVPDNKEMTSIDQDKQQEQWKKHSNHHKKTSSKETTSTEMSSFSYELVKTTSTKITNVSSPLSDKTTTKSRKRGVSISYIYTKNIKQIQRRGDIPKNLHTLCVPSLFGHFFF